MRIIHLEFSDFRSIVNFNHTFNTNGNDIFSPICLVGLNGSGKSNVLEAISEIFSFLDLYSLNYNLLNYKKKIENGIFDFKIQYTIKIDGEDKLIEIQVIENSAPEMNIIIPGSENEVVNKSSIHLFLPTNIIGYSSGDNERISFSYLKSSMYYISEIKDTAKQEEKEVYKSTYTENVRQPKSFFLDSTMNNIVFLVNNIFTNGNDDISDIFREYINIDRLKKFTININAKTIPLTEELEDIINKLIICSSFQEGNIDSVLKLSFILIDSNVKTLFEDEFSNANNLFISLYKLSLLNVLKFTGSEKKLYESLNPVVLPKQSSIPKDKMFFLLDNLEVELKSETSIDYIGLSDGEHQFLLIIGMIYLFKDANTLFLLDEPESHFNPSWRAQFINLISELSPELKQNIILSTHSPYVISSCKKENVLKFKRDKLNMLVHCAPAQNETFGNTFDLILHDLFDIRINTSTYTQEFIKKAIASDNLDIMNNLVLNSAESPEKVKLYDAIFDLKNI